MSEEDLFKQTPKTTEEKLLWERFANKQLVDENKKLEAALIELGTNFRNYKKTVENSQLAQMLNKLNKVKRKNEELISENAKLKSDEARLIEVSIYNHRLLIENQDLKKELELERSNKKEENKPGILERIKNKFYAKEPYRKYG